MRHFRVVFSSITGLEARIHLDIVDVLLVQHFSKITFRITQAGISLVLNEGVGELTVAWRKIYMRGKDEIQEQSCSCGCYLKFCNFILSTYRTSPVFFLSKNKKQNPKNITPKQFRQETLTKCEKYEMRRCLFVLAICSFSVIYICFF